MTHYNKLKNEIVTLLNNNNKINNQLKQFYSILLETVKCFNDFPCYQLMKFIGEIQVNNSNVEFNNERIDFSYIKLKDHLINNHILIFSNQSGCLITLGDHEEKVICLIQLRNGLIASSGCDAVIKLWDPKSFICKGTLKGHTMPIASLIQLKDGQLASASTDNTIRFWDIDSSLSLPTILNPHNIVITCIEQVTDVLIASGSHDKSIKLTNYLTKVTVATLLGHTEFPQCLLLLQDGRFASAGGALIKLWDVKSFQCIGELTGHKRMIVCLYQLSQNELMTSSTDNTIKIWNLVTLKNTSNIATDCIKCLTQLKDGRIISGSFKNQIILWDNKTFKRKEVIEGHSLAVHCLIQLTDGKIVSASADHLIKIWKL